MECVYLCITFSAHAISHAFNYTATKCNVLTTVDDMMTDLPVKKSTCAYLNDFLTL